MNEQQIISHLENFNPVQLHSTRFFIHFVKITETNLHIELKDSSTAKPNDIQNMFYTISIESIKKYYNKEPLEYTLVGTQRLVLHTLVEQIIKRKKLIENINII